MSVDKSKTTNYVDEIKTAIKGVEDSVIDIAEVIPISGEVVIGVCEWIHDELHCDTRDHDYT